MIGTIARRGWAALPRPAQAWIRGSFDLYWRASYAQYAEDLIAESFLRGVNRGFYVDIGAHDPVKFSNTLRFYRSGWHGINVDPNPNAMRRFNAQRPKDVNIEAGIAARTGSMTLFVFDEPALNTFSQPIAERLVSEGRYKLLEKREVAVMRLDSLLDAYLPVGQEIHLMSIDVEGTEAEVIGSNDWTRYKPRLILLEMNDADVAEALNSEMVQQLKKIGYSLRAKTYNTLVLVRKDG